MSKSLDFVDCHGHALHFPWSQHTPAHVTYPNIGVSFPGQKFQDMAAAPDWPELSMVIEVKPEKEGDPFVNEGYKHGKALVQIAVDARNLLHSRGHLAVFVLGVYNDVVRILRFDRASAVVSQPIRLTATEDLKILRCFFWRFVNPCEGSSVVGCDPTSNCLNAEDISWLKGRLALANFDTNGVAFDRARRVEVHDRSLSSDPKPYFAFQVIDVNSHLFSRATTTWLGILDTRRVIRGRVVDGPVSASDLRL